MPIDEYIKKRISDEIRECMKAEYKRLDLRNLSLGAVPPEVYELEELQEFDLSSCNLIGGSNQYFSEEYWWEVTIDDNKITLIDPAIGNVHSLEVLRIDQIELDSIPEEVGDLGLLRHLSARNNGLGEIPDSICNLVNLEYLDLSFNLLNALPNDFGKLKNLRSLNLYGCAFTELPKQVLDLPNLEYLNIGTFDEERIWEDTKEKFYLVGNSITELPMALFRKESLKELNVDGLKLEVISDLRRYEVFDEEKQIQKLSGIESI